MTKHDPGHSIIYIDGRPHRVVTVTPLDNFGGEMDSNVTPIGRAEANRRFREAVRMEDIERSIRSHPSGRRLPCPVQDCNHAAGAHKGDGCAYCKCDKVYVAD